MKDGSSERKVEFLAGPTQGRLCSLPVHRTFQAGIPGGDSKVAETCLEVGATAVGERFLSPEVARVLVLRETHTALSPRELEVLRQLADGASNKEISSALGISVHTAKQYVGSLLQKLQVSDRSIVRKRFLKGFAAA